MIQIKVRRIIKVTYGHHPGDSRLALISFGIARKIDFSIRSWGTDLGGIIAAGLPWSRGDLTPPVDPPPLPAPPPSWRSGRAAPRPFYRLGSNGLFSARASLTAGRMAYLKGSEHNGFSLTRPGQCIIDWQIISSSDCATERGTVAGKCSIMVRGE